MRTQSKMSEGGRMSGSSGKAKAAEIHRTDNQATPAKCLGRETGTGTVIFLSLSSSILAAIFYAAA